MLSAAFRSPNKKFTPVEIILNAEWGLYQEGGNFPQPKKSIVFGQAV